MDNLGVILLMILFVILSAYFSATETAYTSFSRVRLIGAAERKERNAKRVLEYSEKFDTILSTILVGNNIVNIALTAIATAMFVRILGGKGPAISTLVVTVVVLVFGEITPKSLAKESPEKFAMATYPILRFFMIVLMPVNFVFTAWKKLISRIFRNRDDYVTTEKELLTIVGEAEHEGGIDRQESELLRSAIEFNALVAEDILTPRVDISAVSLEDTREQIAQEFRETGYSRLPVYGESLDDIRGVLYMKDFYNRAVGENAPISEIMKEIIFVSPTMKIDDLLKKRQTEKHHMAIITDEYGGTMGLVTMEDILEELVGEIWDEHDEVVEEITKLGESAWRVKASCSYEDFRELFSLEGESEASTAGGWVMEQLGKIPVTGDTFTAGGISVAVTKADGMRILEMLVRVLPKTPAGEEEA